MLTFEEVSAMLDAKEIDITKCEEDESFMEASGDGNGFAVSGGVAKAVEDVLKVMYPDVEVKTEKAEGLQNCKKMLMIAKTGKYNGYLLEGMACPGGCVAGAGTIAPAKKSTDAVHKVVENSIDKNALASKYKEYLSILKDVQTIKAPEDE